MAAIPLLALTPLYASLLGTGFQTMAEAFPKKAADPREAEILVKFKNGVAQAVKDAKHAAEGNQVVREARTFGLQAVRISPAQPVNTAVANYRADPNVEFAEPNFEIRALATPNDPAFPNQWGLLNTGILDFVPSGVAGSDIKAAQAWDRVTGWTAASGAPEVVVMVIDTGIWYTSVPHATDALGNPVFRRHQDLIGNVWTNPGEIPNNGIDDDANGYVDDVHGYDMVNNDGDPLDDFGHGTHVAGILGARGNNSVGIAGVNWNVKIASCKALDNLGKGTIDNAVRCLEYARVLKNQGVNIVVTNNSYGGLSTDPDLTPVRLAAMRDAINAHMQAGMLFVAAAGNSALNNDNVDFFPADYDLPNVISVAATNNSDVITDFSHFGRRTVHVGAPGERIFSLLNGDGNNYGTDKGTSMAAPFVSGVAALIKAANPTADFRTIKNLILSSGDPNTSLAGKTITGRRLNADTATNCVNKPFFSVLKVAPQITVGTPNVISAISINCGAAVGPVTGVTSTGQSITLVDDGTNGDQLAGDGEFTATWTPNTGFQYIDFSSPSGSERLSAVDLVPTAVTAPALANIGDVVTVSVTIANPGTSAAAAPASTANLYLSADGIITSADLLVGTVQVPGIPSGESRTVTTTVTIPTNLAAGTYFIGTIADPANTIVEASEANNALQGNAIIVNAVTVDLAVASVSAPTSGVVGNTISVSGTVQNLGTGSAGTSTLTFYLSTDNVITTADRVVGTATINALAGGASQLASGSVTIPAGLAAGTYYIGAIADTAGVVLESNENNNALAGNTIAVTLPARDLTLTAVGNPSTSRNGAAISLTATVRNTGTLAAPIGTRVRWYLSTDATITTTDTPLGPNDAVFTSTLAGGSTRSVSVSNRIPLDVPAGTYYIGAIVDPDNLVSENNDTNNARASTTRIAVSYTVDLTMTAVAAPAAAATGQNVTFTGTVRNSGAAAAGSTKVNFYLSGDSSIGLSDRLIGSTTLASVAAGASVPVSMTAALRTDLPAGTYYVGAIVDPDNTVAESNNSNNSLASVNRMTTTYGPDMMITSVSGPTIATRGTTMAVSGTVQNIGSGAIGATTDARGVTTVTVGIYLSTNTNITVFDRLIGTYTFTSLGAGASQPFSLNLTVPATMAVGNYYIGAIADRDTVVRESNELNNSLPGTLISVR